MNNTDSLLYNPQTYSVVTIILAISLLFNDTCPKSAKEKVGGILATGGVILFLPLLSMLLKKAFSSRSAGTISGIELCLQFTAGVIGSILAGLLINEKLDSQRMVSELCGIGSPVGLLTMSIFSSIASLVMLYKHYTLRPGKLQRYNAMGPLGGPGVPTNSLGYPRRSRRRR